MANIAAQTVGGARKLTAPTPELLKTNGDGGPFGDQNLNPLSLGSVLNPSPALSIRPCESTNPPTPDQIPYFDKYTNNSETDEANNWIRDLELMHQWTSSTSLTLCGLEEVKYIWQIVVPKEAIAQKFLMHEILAFSALHLAHLRPDQARAYSVLSDHHQGIAVNTIRNLLSSTITSENCNALFAASAIITLTGFASNFTETAPPLDDILDLFLLIRGMHGILKSAWDKIMQGPLARIIKSGLDPPPQPLLEELLCHVEDLKSCLDSKLVRSDVQSLCMDTIANFHESVDMATHHSDGRELRVVFTWPIKLSPDFMLLLRQNEPFALALLAHYCVILHCAEEKYWFIRGWGSKVVKAIANSIDPAWEQCIRWPVQYIMGQNYLPSG